MIRGRKPQAYNTSTKSTDSLLIPAASIDFADQKDLETKAKEIISSIEVLDEAHKTTAATVNKSLDIPKQIGTVVYNGELQAPVWDIMSSRIMISGETVGKEARDYTVTATILNGTWKTKGEEPLAAEQPLVWTISKKKIPKPSVNGIYVEDGTLQEVKLCDYNPKYCSVAGSTKARSAGEYGINVSIVSPNVMWEDGDESSSISLSWKIMSRSADITGAETSIAALTSELNKLKLTVTALQETTAANSTALENITGGHGGATCSCAPIISSLRRRIDLLETFASLDNNTFDMRALIELLTKQVTDLETSASSMSYEVLEEEVSSIVSAINKALSVATDPSDITELNSLKTRVLDVYSINVAGEKLRDFRTDANNRKKEIKDLLEDGDTDGAETELDKLKKDLKDLKDDMDDKTKEKVKALLDELDDIIKDLEKEITRKKVQKILSDIENKIEEIKNKIAADEDPTSSIREAEDLLDTAETMIGDNNLPFEKDRILTCSDELNSLKEQWGIMLSIRNLSATLQDIRDKISSYTDAQLEERISSAAEQLREIKERTARFNPAMFDSDIIRLEDSLDEIRALSWKKQQEQVLESIAARLGEIRDAAAAADPDTDNLSQWDSELDNIAAQLDEIERTAAAKGVVPDNLSSTKTLLDTIRQTISGSGILREIAVIDNSLNVIRNKITDGLIAYETVTEQLDAIEQRISALEKDDNPEDIKNSIILLRAKLINIRQLNEDMKVYLEVKPLLRAIRQRIYDEDLDILWAELAVAEEKIKDAGTSSWIRELQNDIAEIKHILNSFSSNNTVENFLSHLNAAMEIIITVSDFRPVCTTYDEAKLDLQNLEKAALTISDEELVSFPTWYSLSDQDKAYLLENSLRKIRRNVVITEEISA